MTLASSPPAQITSSKCLFILFYNSPFSLSATLTLLIIFLLPTIAETSVQFRFQLIQINQFQAVGRVVVSKDSWTLRRLIICYTLILTAIVHITSQYCRFYRKAKSNGSMRFIQQLQYIFWEISSSSFQDQQKSNLGMNPKDKTKYIKYSLETKPTVMHQEWVRDRQIVNLYLFSTFSAVIIIL